MPKKNIKRTETHAFGETWLWAVIDPIAGGSPGIVFPIVAFKLFLIP
jgi:hypothetical protein